ARKAVSSMLEVAPDDLEFRDGEVRVKGVPQMKRTLGEIAHALSGVPGFALPGNIAPGLAAATDFQPPALTYSNGTHVVEAEVDPETGGVRLTRYVVVHDCGRMINPMISIETIEEFTSMSQSCCRHALASATWCATTVTQMRARDVGPQTEVENPQR